MKNNSYPKILLIGNRINLHWGGGITLYNLIKGWPKEKISIASEAIDKDGLEICTNYYRLGYEETKRIWPLNRFQPYYPSGKVLFSKTDVSNFIQEKYSVQESKYDKRLKRTIEKILINLGIYQIVNPFIKISPLFLKWFDEIKPDIIYTHPNSRYLFFLNKLIKLRKTPLIIHVMDDWIRVANMPGLSKLYWNLRIQKGFKLLVNKSTGLLSICDAMSEEYKTRYNRDFIPFHNCLELRKWELKKRTSYDMKDKFAILYAGRIGRGTSNSILMIARAIEHLGMRGYHIEFQIQTKSIPESIKDDIAKLKFTKVNRYINYDDLPAKFSSVDLLVLPMDFDKTNLDFIHLSMPTKVPEYMASGTPILVFAHKTTALYKYAKKDGWAFIVSDNEIDVLSSTLSEIYKSKNKREDIAKTAFEIMKKNHDCKKVRNSFRKYLMAIPN